MHSPMSWCTLDIHVVSVGSEHVSQDNLTKTIDAWRVGLIYSYLIIYYELFCCWSHIGCSISSSSDSETHYDRLCPLF